MDAENINASKVCPEGCGGTKSGVNPLLPRGVRQRVVAYLTPEGWVKRKKKRKPSNLSIDNCEASWAGPFVKRGTEGAVKMWCKAHDHAVYRGRTESERLLIADIFNRTHDDAPLPPA